MANPATPNVCNFLRVIVNFPLDMGYKGTAVELDMFYQHVFVLRQCKVYPACNSKCIKRKLLSDAGEDGC